MILVSALARMRLCQAEYGLSELRLYTAAAMAWWAVVVWFGATMVRDRRRPFAVGALAAGGQCWRGGTRSTRTR